MTVLARNKNRGPLGSDFPDARRFGQLGRETYPPSAECDFHAPAHFFTEASGLHSHDANDGFHVCRASGNAR